MMNLLANSESSLRLAIFFSIFVFMGVWEIISPCRKQNFSRLFRWSNNLVVSLINVLLLRITLPFFAVGSATVAAIHGFGLFNYIEVPLWVSFVITLLAMDLAIYFQHRLFHLIPIFWRVHRTHHSDIEFDVSTGVRFHPVEILLSMIIKMIIVALLGAPAVGVLVFEILLNATALFSHGNVKISESVDKTLRYLLVTPNMHRIHHSIIPKETNSNFGFNLSWWDRIFGSYCAHPELGHTNMSIGIELFRTKRNSRIDQLLTQPFRND